MEKTALAEAEVEYEDYTSATCDLRRNSRITSPAHGRGSRLPRRVVIWTTTPWTMPGKPRGRLSRGEDRLRPLTEVTDGGRGQLGQDWAIAYILADTLAASVFKQLRASRVYETPARRWHLPTPSTGLDPAAHPLTGHRPAATIFPFRSCRWRARHRRGRHRVRSHRAKPWPRGLSRFGRPIPAEPDAARGIETARSPTPWMPNGALY